MLHNHFVGKGVSAFPGYDMNLPTQLWIIMRYVKALSFCIAPLFIRRPLHAVHWMLGLSLLLSVAAEVAFTQYIGVYGPANEIGYLLTFVSTWLLYRAIIVTGLVRPFDLLLREARLREDGLESRVQRRTFELRESEMKFERLFNSSADAILILDDENRIGEANETAFERLCYPARN